MVDHDWAKSIYFKDPNGIQLEFCSFVRNLNEAQLGRAIRSLLAPTDGRGPFGRRPPGDGTGVGGRAPRLAELSRRVGRSRLHRRTRPEDDTAAAAVRGPS